MTPWSLTPKLAAWMVQKGGWDKGGFRVCRPCRRSQAVSADQIQKWFEGSGTPRCRLCNGKTELLTSDDLERAPL